MVILGLPAPNITLQSFSGAKDSSHNKFLFVIVTPFVNIVKTMFRWVFSSLIVVIFKFN